MILGPEFKKFAVQISRCVKLNEEAAIYCTKCGAKLLDLNIGDSTFYIEQGLCDCSWRCCSHTVERPHTPHRETRTADGRVIAQDQHNP